MLTKKMFQAFVLYVTAATLFANVNAGLLTKHVFFSCSKAASLINYLGIGDVKVTKGDANHLVITADEELFNTLSFHVDFDDSIIVPTLRLFNRGFANGVFRAYGTLELTSDCSSDIAVLSVVGHPDAFFDTSAVSSLGVMLGTLRNESSSEAVLTGTQQFAGGLLLGAIGSGPEFAGVCVDVPVKSPEVAVNVMSFGSVRFGALQPSVDTALVTPKLTGSALGGGRIDSCNVRASAIDAVVDSSSRASFYPMQNMSTMGDGSITYVQSSENVGVVVKALTGSPQPVSHCEMPPPCRSFVEGRYVSVNLQEKVGSAHDMTGSFEYVVAPWVLPTAIGVGAGVLVILVVVGIVVGASVRRKRRIARQKVVYDQQASYVRVP